MTATPARRAALEVLRRVRRGALLDHALDAARAKVPARDAAWLHELSYGAVRLRGRLDHALAGRVRRGLASLEPDVLDILRLGAYQLLEMDSVPDYAAVSQSVELARSAGADRATGLVNGVLKRLAREGWGPFPSFDDEPAAHLATWGSHPAWLVRRWLARYGSDDARALVQVDNRRPELFVRPVGITAAEAASRLDAAGIEAATVALAPDALRIGAGRSVHDVLQAAPLVVQDPAAGLVVRFAEPEPGAVVLDLCAAPGGKCLPLAGEGRRVVAADASAGRMGALRENRERLGDAAAGLAGIVAADARRPPFRPAGAVLVDVPCTGTGTLRRHPDWRWRLSPADVETLAGLQREILDGAAEVVEPGGLLVYATCSLEPEENDEQVEAFLARNGAFTVAAPPPGMPAAVLDGNRLRLLPHRHGMDGAFAVRLRRVG